MPSICTPCAGKQHAASLLTPTGVRTRCCSATQLTKERCHSHPSAHPHGHCPLPPALGGARLSSTPLPNLEHLSLRGCSPGQQGWHGASRAPCRSHAPWDAHQAQGGSQPFKGMFSASALTFFNLIFLFFNGDLLFAYSILPITAGTKFLYAEFVQCSIFTKL